jgi:hypothetical protein
MRFSQKYMRSLLFLCIISNTLLVLFLIYFRHLSSARTFQCKEEYYHIRVWSVLLTYFFLIVYAIVTSNVLAVSILLSVKYSFFKPIVFVGQIFKFNTGKNFVIGFVNPNVLSFVLNAFGFHYFPHSAAQVKCCPCVVFVYSKAPKSVYVCVQFYSNYLYVHCCMFFALYNIACNS